MLNWDIVEGKYKEFKGLAREKWGKLTDDDLEFAKGKRDRFIGKLQERYGYRREEAEKEVQSLLDRISSAA